MIVYDVRQAIPTHIVHFLSPADISASAEAAKQFDSASGFKIKTITIPEPSLHNPEDVDEYHYRVVESQFHRMFGIQARRQITKVEVIFNPRLREAFNAKKQEYEKKNISAQISFGFHGTRKTSKNSICENGFKLDKVGSATDPGWYGAGIYFSERTATSVPYDKGLMLLCELLPGKTKKMKNQDRMDGKPCCKGFTSHTVDEGNEVVMFDMAAILPKYIVHYRD